jgi:hypothetical protein
LVGPQPVCASREIGCLSAPDDRLGGMGRHYCRHRLGSALGSRGAVRTGTKHMIVPLAGEVSEDLAGEAECRSLRCGNSHNCVVPLDAGPRERKLIECHCNAENGTKRARYQRISKISRLSRCYGCPAVARNRGLPRQTPIASLFFRCINSEIGRRL